MEGYQNEKECIVFDKKGRSVSIFDRGRRRRFIRAVRRLFLLVIIIAAMVAFVNSSFADERGMGIDDIKAFFGKGPSESIIPPDTEETESGTDTFEDSGEELSENAETESETVNESETNEENINEITAIDLSESDKGSLYFVNYTDKTPDIEGMLAQRFSGSRTYYTQEPVVMIVHSQTTQAYIDAADDQSAVLQGVVSVGEAVCYELNRRGIPAVHCTVIHDGGGDAYTNTAETIKTMLEVYPSVKYVLDIQRMDIIDERGNMAKTTVSESGAAQLRLTVSAGDARWRDSLSLALHIKEELNASEGICMPVVLTDVEYNSGLSEYYLKIDAGAFGNEFKEAREAGSLFAAAFATVIKK